jgi:hypothetical protein
MSLRHEFTTYVDGEVAYKGDDLESAIRSWDGSPDLLGDKRLPAGGVSVQSWSGDIMVRDGWILHIHEDGQVYLNPNLALSEETR